MTAQSNTASGMPGRYATALFELASEQKKIDQVKKDLGRFVDLLDGSQDLQRLVSSPVYDADDQANAIDNVLASAKITGLTGDFIKLTARNRRLSAITDMIKAYGILVAEARGEVAGEVISAAPLSAAQMKKLQTSLKAAVGRDVELETRVDPAILGGLVVKVGSRMMDNSLRTKLQNLKTAMKGAR